MVIGLGRTYASAARNPGLAPRSAGVVDRAEEIEGVESVVLRLEGVTEDW